jgi:hypothetical protein
MFVNKFRAVIRTFIERVYTHNYAEHEHEYTPPQFLVTALNELSNWSMYKTNLVPRPWERGWYKTSSYLLLILLLY